MIRNSITLAGLLLTAGFADAAITPGGDYDDARLNWAVAEVAGMTVDYPAGIFTIDFGVGDRGPGRVFRSADGTADFTLYVQPNTKHDTPRSFFSSKLSGPYTKLDYLRVTERFVAVSGIREGRIYYSRCNFPYGTSGPIHCLEMVYDESEKRLWDPIVTRMSLSLR